MAPSNIERMWKASAFRITCRNLRAASYTYCKRLLASGNPLVDAAKKIRTFSYKSYL